MKEHYSQAPSTIRRKVDAVLADHRRTAAENWLEAATICWTCGYDLDPPPDAATKKIEELRASGNFAALSVYRQSGGFEEESREQRARLRWEGMAKWRLERSESELAAERLGAALEAEREAQIEARAAEILAKEDRSQTDKRKAAARKAAEKEMQ